MTTTSATDVIGYATYLELRRPVASGTTTVHVFQHLVMPEYVTPAFTVPASVYQRRMSSIHPRATWRHASSNSITGKVLARPDVAILVASSQQLAVANTVAEFTARQALAFANSWELFKSPIVVEVTAADIEDVRISRTPYKVLGRVWKSRKKLGFPDFFDLEVPAL